jgi:hypothetical protein
MDFHHFANIKKAINVNKRFFFLNYTFLDYIILQSIIKLVAKIVKYFNKIVLPYMGYSQNMAKFSYG